MLKILFIIAVFVVIYFLFFKKPKPKVKNKELEDMVECESCGVFISVEEAIEKNGKYYCSKECLN